MARYFFHVHDGKDLCDEEGTELPTIEAARSEAARYAGMLLQNPDGDLWSGEPWRMDVTNESGLLLFTLMFLATDAPALRTERLWAN